MKLTKHKWPHERLDYPIKCSNCEYQVLTKNYTMCQQKNVVFKKGAAFMACDWYKDKRKGATNAEKIKPKTKPQNLEKGCESTQKKPDAIPRRNQTVKECDHE